MRYALPLVSMLLVTAPASAQSVDQIGADQIAGSLSRYVGKTAFDKGIIKVSPDGDAYRLVVDLNAAATLLPKELEASLEIDPYVLRLKPGADGTFAVDGPYLPRMRAGFLTPATPDAPSVRTQFELDVEKGALSGVFDPAIGTFSTARITHGLMSFSTQEPAQNLKATVAEGEGDFKATPGASGIDFTSSQTIRDLFETVTPKDAAGADKDPISIKAKRLVYDASASNLQYKPLLALMAFFVDHSDEKSIAASQAELKSLLMAALPLWNTMTGGYDISGLSVDTPTGTFTAERLAAGGTLDGIGKDRSIDYAFELAGIAIPPGLAPDWTTPLMPTEISLKFGARHLNSDGPVRQFIEAFDLTAAPPVPDEVGQRILAEFMADPPHFVLERSVVRNKEIEVAVLGEMPFPKDKPAGTATVEIKGYDKAVAALQAAATSNPEAQTAFTFALAAKGFAKTEPDGRLVWAIELKQDGSMLVNGSVLKGPDPAPDPAEAPEAPTP